VSHPYFSAAESAALAKLLDMALKEDLGTAGDLTSQALIPEQQVGKAALVARQPGVLAGMPAALACFWSFADLDKQKQIKAVRPEGCSLNPGDRLAVVEGSMRSILAAERTALNFVQRLSGIATLTRRYVDAVAGLSCRILDTRKTTPGWRLLEKYAVRCGGGHNHRTGLYDGILIKDNHLAALAGHADPVGEAVRRARQKHGTSIPLEIEVDTLAQLDQALAERPDIVLLDNMTPDQMREAVRRRNAVAPGLLLEASGGVTLQTVRGIAEAGVDRVSVGALTHSAPALDIGLDYLP
jgi:nicotinate-nucleotide pyrophosphorylase (carboxylating)